MDTATIMDTVIIIADIIRRHGGSFGNDTKNDNTPHSGPVARYEVFLDLQILRKWRQTIHIQFSQEIPLSLFLLKNFVQGVFSVNFLFSPIGLCYLCG